MQVTNDRIYGLDVYRVDGAPVVGRASDEHDDHWYIHVKGDSIYAFVPTADGSGYEDIVVDESHDTAQRWNLDSLNTNRDLERFAKSVRSEVDDILIDRAMDQIDRMMDAGELKLHFHGSDGDGYLSGHEAAIGSEADIRKEAAGLAKEFVDVGSGDEDWSGWKIVASTEPDGKGIEVAQFGFEELGVWSPKPEVEFDPTETYTGFGTDKYEAFRNALSKAREDGLTFDAAEGLAMDVEIDADADGELFTRVDIQFRPNESMTVMSDDSLRKVVDGEDIDQVIDTYDEDWVVVRTDAVEQVVSQWKADYLNGESGVNELVSICNRADDNDRNIARYLALGGENESTIEAAYRRFILQKERGDSLLLVTSKGDGIIRRDYNLKAVEWDEVEKAIADRLAKTGDEDEIAKLKGMLAAPVRPREFPPSPDVIASFETKAVESSGISR